MNLAKWANKNEGDLSPEEKQKIDAMGAHMIEKYREGSDPVYEIKIKALKEMKAYLPLEANSAKEAIAIARQFLDEGDVLDDLDDCFYIMSRSLFPL